MRVECAYRVTRRRPHRPTWLRVVRNAGGVLLLLLGVVGLFLPILQGVVMIVLGLGLVDIEAKHTLHRWLRRRWRCYRSIALRHQRVRRYLRMRRVRRG